MKIKKGPSGKKKILGNFFSPSTHGREKRVKFKMRAGWAKTYIMAGVLAAGTRCWPKMRRCCIEYECICAFSFYSCFLFLNHPALTGANEDAALRAALRAARL